MTRNTRSLGLTALVALLVLTAGCVGGLAGDNGDGTDNGDIDDEDIDAGELRTNVVEAAQDIETVSVTMEMEMEMESSSREVAMDISMATNRTAEKARMEMSLDSVGMEVTSYVIGDTLYVERNGDWFRQTQQADPWEDNQQLQSLSLLQEGAIEIVGTETFDGHEVYVVNVDVDGETLRESMAQITGPGQTGMFEEIAINEISITQYIDVENYHVRHTEMDYEMEAMGEQADATATITFEDFNEPVDITLPDEAEDAAEMPDSPMGG